jgi:hypothetical protein
MNCSTVSPDYFRMSARVPLAHSSCMGTTVLKTSPPARFSSDTWLPFCLNSPKPERFKARTTRWPETLGSFGMSSGHFDGRPKGVQGCWMLFGNSPSLEIKLDRFREICACGLNIFSLRSDIELGAAGHVPPIVLRDERRKPVSHAPIRTRTRGTRTRFDQSLTTSHWAH